MFLSGTDVYEGNNKSSRWLSKAYKESGESEHAPVVRSDNQNVVGYTAMFYEPMEMFKKIPFNNSLKENSWVHLKASKGETSMYYMFLKKMQVVVLIKSLDTYVTANISVRTSAGAKLNASSICNYVPRPLASWWKSIDVALKCVALSVSHTDYLIVFNVFSHV